jgi:hypothetical protein
LNIQPMRAIAASVSAAVAIAIALPAAAPADVVVPHVATHSVTPHAAAPLPAPSAAPSPEPPSTGGTQSQWEPPGWVPAPDSRPAPSERDRPTELPTDSPLGPFDPGCGPECKQDWRDYYQAEADRLGVGDENALLVKLLKATGEAIEGEIASERQYENDRALSRAAAQQDHENDGPDAISGGDLNAPDEPVTYTEVTDQLVDPILCVLGTYVSINNWLEDPVGGSNACF